MLSSAVDRGETDRQTDRQTSPAASQARRTRHAVLPNRTEGRGGEEFHKLYNQHAVLVSLSSVLIQSRQQHSSFRQVLHTEAIVTTAYGAFKECDMNGEVGISRGVLLLINIYVDNKSVIGFSATLH